MTIEQCINEVEVALSSLEVRCGSESSAQRIAQKIKETAGALAPIMVEKTLMVRKGSGSPTTQKSFQRIYLEYPGASHDARHKANANVLGCWEWQVRSKYGFSPIAQRDFYSFCDALVWKASQAAPYTTEME